MQRSDLGFLLPVVALLVMAPVAQAQDPVEYSVWDYDKRCAAALGANYEFFGATGAEAVPTTDKEFSLGFYVLWNFVPKLDFVGQSAYLVDNQHIRSGFGANYTIYQGAFDLGVRALYEFNFAAGDEPTAEPGKEWNVGLGLGYPLNNWLVATGSTQMGLDTKIVRSAIGLRAVLKKQNL